MRILIGCEFSGNVREAFRSRGHDVYSCDLVDSLDNSPFHLKMDIFEAIRREVWDMAVFFPPCTYLTKTGNRWYTPKYLAIHPERLQYREAAIQFVRDLMVAPIPRIAIENPVGFLSTAIRKPDQIIQPYQFGHPVSKATCLWLKGLPLLTGTELVEPKWVTLPSGKRMSRFHAESFKISGPARMFHRSVTFPGIATAMAVQWGK